MHVAAFFSPVDHTYAAFCREAAVGHVVQFVPLCQAVCQRVSKDDKTILTVHLRDALCVRWVVAKCVARRQSVNNPMRQIRSRQHKVERDQDEGAGCPSQGRSQRLGVRMCGVPRAPARETQEERRVVKRGPVVVKHRRLRPLVRRDDHHCQHGERSKEIIRDDARPQARNCAEGQCDKAVSAVADLVWV